MLIRNNFDSLHHAMYVPTDSHTEIGPGGKKQFSSSVASAKDILLTPGLNAVSTDVWRAAVSANPHLAKLVAAGKLEELGEYDSEAPEKDVLKLVETCVQEEFLVALQEHEKRPLVKKAIEKQLGKIANYVKSKHEG